MDARTRALRLLSGSHGRRRKGTRGGRDALCRQIRPAPAYDFVFGFDICHNGTALIFEHSVTSDAPMEVYGGRLGRRRARDVLAVHPVRHAPHTVSCQATNAVTLGRKELTRAPSRPTIGRQQRDGVTLDSSRIQTLQMASSTYATLGILDPEMK